MEMIYHKTVKKVTTDFEALAFNTAISQLMIFVNEAYKAEKIYIGFIEGLVKLLSPICPHICEELWESLGHNKTIAYEAWPTYDEAKTVDNVVTYAVSVNGKFRDKLACGLDVAKDDVIALAKELDKVKAQIEGKEIVKVIVVPGKIVNIVVK